MKRKYGPKQGIFTPIYKEKYSGSYPIIYRSSWELKAMMYLDRNSNVLEWGSESTIIKYKDPSRGNTSHRYFIDLFMKVRTKDKQIKKYIIEIKPYKETQLPIKGKKQQKTYLAECATYIRNRAKWEAAKKYAESHGMKFIIWTEKELRIQ